MCKEKGEEKWQMIQKNLLRLRKEGRGLQSNHLAKKHKVASVHQRSSQNQKE